MSRTTCILLAVACCASLAAAGEIEEGFVSIFNGKDLAGWKAIDDVWSVRDGVLVGTARPPKLDHNSFITSEKEYGDFELRIEFRLKDGKGNSGVQYRSKRVPNSHEVSGYQADLGAGWWGCLYDEARRNSVLQKPVDAAALEKVLKPADWNTYAIRAQGNRVQQFINGVKTVDYVEKDANIRRKGVVAPQTHAGPPGEVYFRNIRIKEL